MCLYNPVGSVILENPDSYSGGFSSEIAPSHLDVHQKKMAPFSVNKVLNMYLSLCSASGSSRILQVISKLLANAVCISTCQ